MTEVIANSRVRVVRGDLVAAAKTDPDIDVIVHGCNCFCTMGAGVAKAIASAFPKVREVDNATASGDRSKMGTYTSCVCAKDDGSPLTVVNAYTQYRYGRFGKHFDGEAFRSVLERFNVDFAGKTVGMPWIGCGLAGGSREEVFRILNGCVKNFECIVFEL